METRTLELSQDDNTALMACLLHEREYMRNICGATSTPTIDRLIQKFHTIFPEHNWIRFL